MQLQGDVSIRVRDAHGIRDIILREGEAMFGLVVERRRPPTETEHLIFYCEKCDAMVYDQEFACSDIVNHFRKAMEAFWADPKLCTCPSCGTRVPKPAPRTK